MIFRLALILGCLYGLTAVGLGAMGAHALQSKLTPKLLHAFQVGAKYQLIHAVLLVGLGLWARSFPSRWITYAVVSIAAGVLLFSGSLYILALLKWRVGILTPIGGVFMILGWVFMLIAAFNMKV